MDYLRMTDNELLFYYLGRKDSGEISVPLWIEHNKRLSSDGDYIDQFFRLLTRKSFFTFNPCFFD